MFKHRSATATSWAIGKGTFRTDVKLDISEWIYGKAYTHRRRAKISSVKPSKRSNDATSLADGSTGSASKAGAAGGTIFTGSEGQYHTPLRKVSRRYLLPIHHELSRPTLERYLL